MDLVEFVRCSKKNSQIATPSECSTALLILGIERHRASSLLRDRRRLFLSHLRVCDACRLVWDIER